jgi:outer membrane protein assembly factor BamB
VQNLFGVASAPLIDGERLIVVVGGSPPGATDKNFLDLKSTGSCIVAINKSSGRILYRCGYDLAGYGSPQIAVFGGKKTGIVFARNGLLAFDPEQGKVLFQLPFRSESYNSVNASSIVVSGNQLFLTESYQAGCCLLELKNSRLEPAWSARPHDRDTGLCCHWNTPILVDGCLYGCASRTRGDAELRCIKWASGKVVWTHRPLLGDEPVGRGSLAYADGYFFCLSEEGGLFLIKANAEHYEEMAVWNGAGPNSGRPAGKPLLCHPCWAAPVLSHGLLYLRGRGQLVCLEAAPSRSAESGN